jgi:hypothetical protein
MEHHHAGVFARLALFWMGHIAHAHPQHRDYMRTVSRMLNGDTRVRMGNLHYSVAQTLASGSPWTSSAYFCLNILTCNYLVDGTRAFRSNTPPRIFRGEGDDLLLALRDGEHIDIEEIRKRAVALGVKVKLNQKTSFYDASFCGRHRPAPYLPVTTDPKKVLLNLF